MRESERVRADTAAASMHAGIDGVRARVHTCSLEHAPLRPIFFQMRQAQIPKSWIPKPTSVDLNHKH